MFDNSRFDNLNHELNRPLLKGKNKKVIGLMKSETGEKYWKHLLHWDQIYSYLTDNKDEDKRVQKSVIKRKFTFKDYENCL